MKTERIIACILPFLLCVVSFSIGQVRTIDNKGTIRQIDTSKWKLSGNNIYNKNMGGNVGIGTTIPTAKLTIANGTLTKTTLPVLKLDTLFSGNTSDSLTVWRVSDSTVRKISPISVLRANYMSWFYMPSIPINTSATGPGQINLYNLYQTQFVSPAVASSGAPVSIPYVPSATSLYYYVTSYDASVFNNIGIDVNGVMSYNVISTATPASYINIVFVLK